MSNPEQFKQEPPKPRENPWDIAEEILQMPVEKGVDGKQQNFEDMLSKFTEKPIEIDLPFDIEYQYAFDDIEIEDSETGNVGESLLKVEFEKYGKLFRALKLEADKQSTFDSRNILLDSPPIVGYMILQEQKALERIMNSPTDQKEVESVNDTLDEVFGLGAGGHTEQSLTDHKYKQAAQINNRIENLKKIQGRLIDLNKAIKPDRRINS